MGLELLKHGEQVGQCLARAGGRGYRDGPAGQNLWDGHRLHSRWCGAPEQANGVHKLGAHAKPAESGF
jgi:hypothetical protein